MSDIVDNHVHINRVLYKKTCDLLASNQKALKAADALAKAVRGSRLQIICSLKQRESKYFGLIDEALAAYEKVRSK